MALYRYEMVESTVQGADVTPPAAWIVPDVEVWLGAQAADINFESPLDVNTDLFSQGFDRWAHVLAAPREVLR